MNKDDDLNDTLDDDFQDEFSDLEEGLGTQELDGELDAEFSSDLDTEFNEGTAADAALEAELSEDGAAAPAKVSAPAGQGFLATPASKALFGGGVFVALMASVFIYSMLSGGPSQAPSPGPQMAAGDPWGQPLAQAPEQPGAALPAEVATVTELASEQPLPATPKSVGSSAVQQTLARLNNSPAPAAPAQVADPADQVAEQAAPVAGPSVDALEQLKSEIIAAVKNEVEAGKPAAIPSETAEILRALQTEINQLRQQLSEQNVANSTKAKEKKVEETGPRAGRARLKGFQVINSTEDGKMSVVKTPRGAVIVLFEGESFLVAGKRVKVQQIVEEGKLLLAGDKGYIDTVLEELPKQRPRSKAAARPKAAAPAQVAGSTVTQVVINGDQVVKRIVPAGQTPSSVVTRHGRIAAQAKPAHGWHLNASMQQGFLVKSPRGEFKLVRQGDLIEGIGIVDGLDNEGNLRAGIYKISKE